LGALVLAFSPEIKGIAVADTSETWSVARGPRERLADNVETLTVKWEEGSETTSRSVAIAGGSGDVQAAIPLRRTATGLIAAPGRARLPSADAGSARKLALSSIGWAIGQNPRQSQPPPVEPLHFAPVALGALRSAMRALRH